MSPRCERDPRRRTHGALPSGRMTGCSITASQASAEVAEVAYISRLIAGCFRFFLDPVLRPAGLSSLGQDYSVFSTISATRKGYAGQRAG